VYDPKQSAVYPHQAQAVAYESEDVHMQTMKNTVNPAMLKSLAAIPAPAPGPAPAPISSHKPQLAPAQQLVPQRSQAAHAHIYGGSEDVYMKTAKHDVRTEKEKGLQLWERELLDSQEVKRKATVAQIFFLDYYCEPQSLRLCDPVFPQAYLSSRPPWLHRRAKEASRTLQE
jgi:non-specific serine/threonine protein kinase